VSITFACSCGASITVPDNLGGKQGKCKKCGKLITAPAKASAAKKAPAVVASSDATLSEAAVSDTNVDTEDEETPKGTPGMRQGVVKFKCPTCKIELKVPLNLAGKQGKCRKCGASFVSPVPQALREARARLATQAGSSLKNAFSVQKVKCTCGVTSAILKGRGDGEERCPACGQALALT
jgi:hypothetical protein